MPSTVALPVHFLTLTQLQAAYRSGALSPRDAVAACLARIGQLDDRLHAFLQVRRDDAMAAAEAAGSAMDPGQLLWGVPYALKDIIDVRGLPTTCHSRPRAHDVAASDSEVKTSLDQAGAILLGKNSLHELATGGPSFDLAWPPARNPWNPQRHPGGSSSGSGVAVAAGMAYFALGTDTSGSVRHPGTACGVYGLKPTFDAISTKGVVPLSGCLDHVGVLTRGARDLAAVMAAIATGSSASATADRDTYARLAQGTDARPLSGYTVGVIDSFSTALQPDPAIATAFLETVDNLRRAGCRVVSVAAPPLAEFGECVRTLLYAEAYTYHGAAIEAAPALFGDRTRRRVLQGKGVDAATYIRMRDRQRELSRELARALAGVDVALALSNLYFPCAIDDPQEVERTYDKHARGPFNLSGLPAVSVPCGLAGPKMPMGVQVAAGVGGDTRLVEFVIAMEQAGLCGFMPPPL